MAFVKPFTAIRPINKLVHRVACLPYDVMNREEAKKMAQNNPYSFLHVTRAEIDLDDSIQPYHEDVYEKSCENLEQMIQKRILIQDTKPFYYIYRQIMDGRVQTGIVACASIDEYESNQIKKHEFTRHEKELDRIKHFDYCNANTEPVFLTYRDEGDIRQILNHWASSHEPVYNFTTQDGITHILWIIDDENVIKHIFESFLKIKNLYIADGHHRTASSVKVGLKRRKQYANYTGDEEFNYFLSVLFPDHELYIMEYNRVVKDLNGLTKDAFLKKINEKFDIEICAPGISFLPIQKHTFGMFLEGKWYKLTAKKNTFNEKDLVDQLDVSILQNNLLAPILGIQDPRTDQRIDFIGGIRGLSELEKRASQDMKVGFSLFPTTISDLLAIADANKIMPPKSTWFEPKLRSGLFIHNLD